MSTIILRNCSVNIFDANCYTEVGETECKHRLSVGVVMLHMF